MNVYLPHELIDSITQTDSLCPEYMNEIQFTSLEEADYIFEEIDTTGNGLVHNVNNLTKSTKNIIYKLPECSANYRSQFNENLRTGTCVDNNIPFKPFSNYTFSHLDICNQHKHILSPLPYIPHHFITQQPRYWLSHAASHVNYFGRVYWSGRSSNHSHRSTFYNFYTKCNDDRFDIREFQPHLNEEEEKNKDKGIYWKPPDSGDVYTDYMNNLATADMFFIIRGDLQPTFSLLDTFRAGCIPILIDSVNGIGWENMMYNPDNYMLRFSLEYQTMDEIHDQIVHLLDDPDRVMWMKNNIQNMYKKFIQNTIHPWATFYLAKCIEIWKNSICDLKLPYTDTKRYDNKFISSEVLPMYGLTSKI